MLYYLIFLVSWYHYSASFVAPLVGLVEDQQVVPDLEVLPLLPLVIMLCGCQLEFFILWFRHQPLLDISDHLVFIFFHSHSLWGDHGDLFPLLISSTRLFQDCVHHAFVGSQDLLFFCRWFWRMFSSAEGICVNVAFPSSMGDVKVVVGKDVQPAEHHALWYLQGLQPCEGSMVGT